MKKTFDIRWWLRLLVLLLMVPSLILSILWFRQAMSQQQRLDVALTGLETFRFIEQKYAGLIVQENLVTSSDAKGPFDAVGDLAPEQRGALTKLAAKLDKPGSDIKELALLQKALTTISRHTYLDAATPAEYAPSVTLISEALPSVLLETSRLIKVFRSLAGKDKFNAWDRMSAPVQAGQFKISSDRTARISKDDMSAGGSIYSEDILDLTSQFRKVNLKLQSALGKQVRILGTAKSGREIDLTTANEAHANLMKTGFALWQALFHDLRIALENKRKQATQSAIYTALTGAAIVFIALLLSFILSRALAARTLREIDYASYHDILTGLPNRRALIHQLDHRLKDLESEQTCPQAALLHIDLSRYKAINNAFGEKIGDDILRDVASHLMAQVGENGSVYRTEGSGFVLVDFENYEDALLDSIGFECVEAINKIGAVHDTAIKLNACVGIAKTNESCLSAQQLLGDAELALRSSKRDGLCGVSLFQPQMRLAFERNNKVAEEIAYALARDYIEPWFQPQVDLNTHKVIGIEALVRWIDPENGVRFPGYFLTAATEAGFLEDLDAVVRRKSLATVRRLNEKFKTEISVGLNLSANFLSKPDNISCLLDEIHEAGVSASAVNLEILESVMLDEASSRLVKENISKLSDLGFRLELDDFGTGHASISSLRDLNINRVKIDRSFVQDIHEKSDLQTFTRALIQLSQSLNIEVLAEGVETEAEQNWLFDHGCSDFQGFLIAKALPENQLIGFVEEFNNKAANQNDLISVA